MTPVMVVPAVVAAVPSSVATRQAADVLDAVSHMPAFVSTLPVAVPGTLSSVTEVSGAATRRVQDRRAACPNPIVIDRNKVVIGITSLDATDNE